MRGDHPVVSAASWIVSASILDASVANPDTVVSRLRPFYREAHEADRSRRAFRALAPGSPGCRGGDGLRAEPEGPRQDRAGAPPAGEPLGRPQAALSPRRPGMV